MEHSTKNRILAEAFKMFAERGYEGANLRDLAARLGLSKSALYKHFKSKDDIWDSLIDFMEEYYASRFEAAAGNVQVPKNKAEFLELVNKTVSFTIYDENLSTGRRLVQTEHFRSAKSAKFAKSHFVHEVTARFEDVFETMMKAGVIKEDDAGFLSVLFVSPVSELIAEADYEKPINKGVYIDKIMEFADMFFSRLEKEGSK